LANTTQLSMHQTHAYPSLDVNAIDMTNINSAFSQVLCRSLWLASHQGVLLQFCDVAEVTI
jgi:hypothetical protein